jgi:RNA polymerase sigma-70 factor, ECF subfamily
VNREEFTTFYSASFHRLVGQLGAMTGSQAEAQDAVQEAFVRAWAQRGRFSSDDSPESWIRVTAWRIAVSRWRRNRAGSRLMPLAAQPDTVPGPSPDRVAFIKALRKLPAEQRRAIVLYHLCDLTIDQVARETGVPAGTVKARLARGRAALRPHVSDAPAATTPSATTPSATTPSATTPSATATS